MQCMQTDDKQHRSILQRIAHGAMTDRGLLPDFPPEALAELAGIQAPATMEGEQVLDVIAKSGPGCRTGSY